MSWGFCRCLQVTKCLIRRCGETHMNAHFIENLSLSSLELGTTLMTDEKGRNKGFGTQGVSKFSGLTKWQLRSYKTGFTVYYNTIININNTYIHCYILTSDAWLWYKKIWQKWIYINKSSPFGYPVIFWCYYQVAASSLKLYMLGWAAISPSEHAMTGPVHFPPQGSQTGLHPLQGRR